MEIIKTSISKPPKFLFYADSGIGKTDLASSFPKPIIVRAEDRHDHFVDLDVSKVHTDAAMLVADLKWLLTGEHDFKTVVLDTFDTVQDIIYKHLCKKYNATSIRDPYCKPFSFGAGKEIALAFWVDEIFTLLDELSSKRKMIVVGLAHLQAPWEVDNEGNSYPQYKPLIDKKVEQKLEGFFDVIGFMELKTVSKQVDTEGGAVSVLKTTGERVVHFESSPRFLSKSWLTLNKSFVIPQGKGWDVLKAAIPSIKKSGNLEEAAKDQAERRAVGQVDEAAAI